MRVLGVDPGLTRCGIGVVDSLPGRRVALVAVSVARTSANTPTEARLLALARTLGEWMDMYKPDAVAVERVFAQRNVMTVTGTAQVAGLAMVEAARRGIAVAVHTPTEVKAAVTGSGGAGKAQVQQMVRRLLRLEDPPTPADAADALALAICHVWRGNRAGQMARTGGGGAPGGPAGAGASGGTTAAQRQWLEAERAARRRR
ncbi:MAG: crossover junction endodeoxyribonuclease RuvC [Bifidobacteriaceae bacterium]|jgi:crossover junction endodeoxyribonuclease RuvC|nr:crossover junction endodeoxyribonuclease RuvC [Bifidobacteriaceae bacterium]